MKNKWSIVPRLLQRCIGSCSRDLFDIVLRDSDWLCTHCCYWEEVLKSSARLENNADPQVWPCGTDVDTQSLNSNSNDFFLSILRPISSRFLHPLLRAVYSWTADSGHSHKRRCYLFHQTVEMASLRHVVRELHTLHGVFEVFLFLEQTFVLGRFIITLFSLSRLCSILYIYFKVGQIH